MSAPGPDADLVQRQLSCRLFGVRRPLYAQHELFRVRTHCRSERFARLLMNIGVCAGAKVANTRLLDGKRATTHWYYLKELRDKHPGQGARRRMPQGMR